MLYFLDTEFLEDGETIMPISAALVREGGHHLYVEFPFDREKALRHDFVREHVLPHLRRPGGTQWRHCAEQPWWEFKDERGHASGFEGSFPEHVDRFLGNDPAPQFWAYYADYDWVLFCQRYGTMMDLPERFPKFCMDLQQWYVQLGRPGAAKPPKPDDAHDALADARWNARFHQTLSRIAQRRDAAATHDDARGPAPERSPGA